MQKLIKYVLLFLSLLIIYCAPNYSAIKEPEQPRKQPIVVSIDREFSIEQQFMIEKAFSAWEDVSNNTIKFIIIWEQAKPGMASEFYQLDGDEGIFMFYVSKEDRSQITEGVYNKIHRYLGLVVSADDSASIFIFKEA